MINTNNKIVVLSGGVGGAKFLEGLIQIVPQEDIFVVGNTGDDKEFYGLHVSPDLDIVMYTLAGVVNESQGWGLIDETYNTMNQLTILGNDDWFLLGDKDLATHIHRTNLLKQGKTLSKVTATLCEQFNLKISLVPMSDQSMQTHIKTPRGLIHFEEYFVKHRAQDEVLDIVSVGIETAEPAIGILDAIAYAQLIIVAPSNPLVSIGTILAVPGIRDALQRTNAKVVAVSPIVQGLPIKGPANKMMKAMNIEVSPVGIATYYKDFLDVMVIDKQDAVFAKDIEEMGIKTIVTDTIMKDKKTKKDLAEIVIRSVRQ